MVMSSANPPAAAEYGGGKFFDQSLLTVDVNGPLFRRSFSHYS